MPDFIEVAVKATGAKQIIPAHWLTHPVLGAPFKETPSARAAEEKRTKATAEVTRSARTSGRAKAKAVAEATDNAPAAGDKED